MSFSLTITNPNNNLKHVVKSCSGGPTSYSTTAPQPSLPKIEAPKNDETEISVQGDRPIEKKPIFCQVPGCKGLLCRVQFKNQMPFYKCTKCRTNPAIRKVAKPTPKEPIKCCLVSTCINSSAKIESWKTCKIRPFPCPRHKCLRCNCKEPYSMIPFPDDALQRRLWLHLVRRIEKRFSFDEKRHAICSLHFIDEKVTKRVPFPIVNLGLRPAQFLQILEQYYDKSRMAQFKAILDEICEEEKIASAKLQIQKPSLFDHEYKSSNSSNVKAAGGPPKLSTISPESPGHSSSDNEDPPNLSSSNEIQSPSKESNSVQTVADKKPVMPRIAVKVMPFNTSIITNAVNINTNSKPSEKFCLKSGVQANLTPEKEEPTNDKVPVLSNEVIQCELEVGRSGLGMDPRCESLELCPSQPKRLKSNDTYAAHTKAIMRGYSSLTTMPACDVETCISNKVFCAQLVEEIKTLGREIVNLNVRKRVLTGRLQKPTQSCSRCEKIRSENIQLLNECRRLQTLLVPTVDGELEKRGKPISQQRRENVTKLKRGLSVMATYY